MTAESLWSLPVWAHRLAWSLISILAALLLGQFIARTVCRRLAAWASKTTWKWDDLLIAAVQRGVPFWSFLIGVYVALDLWPLPAHLLEALNRIVYILAWLSVTIIAADAVGRGVLLYGSQFQQAVPVTSLTGHIAKILVVALGMLMILHGLGISIAPLLTALGVGGLAVALALQDTLSNLFAGFYVTVARQIRVGDYIKLESGHEGYVEDTGWRTTTIRTLAGNMVLVPNNKLGQTIITNYHLPSRELAVTLEVGVDYRSDLSHVERVTTEVAAEVMRSVEGGMPKAQPAIRYHGFGESSVNFTVVLRAREFVDQYLLQHELIKRLHARYQREGIIIPFPARTVYVKGDEGRHVV